MSRPGAGTNLSNYLAVVVCCAMWIAFGSIVVESARQHDFLNLYTGGTLAREGNFRLLYSPEVQLARERVLVPSLKLLVPFVRPHLYAVLLEPLSWIPFGPAFWFWVGLQAAVLVGCWLWAGRQWGTDALVFGAVFLPTALGIAHGQDCVLLLAISILSYRFAEQKRDLAAGLILGAGLIKFHLFLLWPLVMLVQKRWRMLSGWCSTAGILAGASLLLGGRDGLAGYFRLLTNPHLERLNPSAELTICVHGLALNLAGGNMGLRAVLVAAVVVLVVVGVRGAPLWRTWAIAATGSLLVPPHVYGYDAGLLLLPLWLAVFESRQRFTRIAATVLITPLPFLMGLAGPPWAAAAPIALLAFLGCLVVEERPLKAFSDAPDRSDPSFSCT